MFLIKHSDIWYCVLLIENCVSGITEGGEGVEVQPALHEAWVFYLTLSPCKACKALFFQSRNTAKRGFFLSFINLKSFPQVSDHLSFFFLLLIASFYFASCLHSLPFLLIWFSCSLFALLFCLFLLFFFTLFPSFFCSHLSLVGCPLLAFLFAVILLFVWLSYSLLFCSQLLS